MFAVITLLIYRMIKRELYLNHLREFIDKPFVKVIAGLRRSGKSSILMLLRDELLSKDVGENDIIKLKMPGAIFFRHKRVGDCFTPFACLKRSQAGNDVQRNTINN